MAKLNLTKNLKLARPEIAEENRKHYSVEGIEYSDLNKDLLTQKSPLKKTNLIKLSSKHHGDL